MHMHMYSVMDMDEPVRRVTFDKPGVAVWYYPVIGRAPCFPAVTATAAFKLGDGTWVVHLNVGDDYREWSKTDRRKVHAASLAAIQLRGNNGEPKLDAR